MRRRLTIALLLAIACGGGDEDEEIAPGDTVGELALPPSAGAPRATLPGGGPDTLAPDDTAEAPPPIEPGPGEPLTPPSVLDVGAIANAYRRYYQEQFAEMGSTVRGDVDPEIVEEAKRRTALDYAYVEVSAWNDLLADLDSAQRAELAQRLAAANRDIARELHGAP